MKLQELLNVTRTSSKLRVVSVLSTVSWEQKTLFEGFETDFNDIFTPEFKALCEEHGQKEIRSIGASSDLNGIPYMSILLCGWEA